MSDAVVPRIDIDRASPMPLYHQVATAIEAAIDGGVLAPGDFLENEVNLAGRLGISRPTARQALAALVEKGRLVRKRGVGTQVAPAHVRRTVGLTSLNSDLEQAGQHPSTELLEHAWVHAEPDVAEALGMPTGSLVLRLRRLRHAAGEPLAVLTNWLPPACAPEPEELAAGGLYDALRARGFAPHVARQRIGARLGTAAEARLLGEPGTVAVLTMERTAYDTAGGPIELGRHVYRAGRYAFDTTVTTA